MIRSAVACRVVITVPEEFAAERIRKSGAAGRRWVSELPSLVDSLSRCWGVKIEGTTHFGDLAVVVPGWRGDEPCVLKVSWHEHPTAAEAVALRAWAGQGAVRLLDASVPDGALLLERLDPSRSLEDLDLLQAAEIAGGLIRTLAVPAPQELPRLADATHLADGIAERQAELGSPIPQRWADTACVLARDLVASTGSALVHTDLHYGNVLAGSRQPWLAIDPRPVAGDPERSVPELMWWRLSTAARPAEVKTLLHVLVSAGDLDPDKARGWTIVRTASYWQWCLGAGLTKDPVRCRRVLEALA